MSLFDNRMYKYVLEEKWRRKTHAALITSTPSIAQMGEKPGVVYCKGTQHMPWLLEHAHQGVVMACGKVEAVKRGQRFAQPPDKPICPSSVFEYSVRAYYGHWESTKSAEEDLGLQLLQSCCHANSHWTWGKWKLVRISKDIFLCIKKKSES